MNLYHLTLRRVRNSHAIPHLLVELSARAPQHVTAAEVLKSVEQRWLGWQVAGIEKTL